MAADMGETDRKMTVKELMAVANREYCLSQGMVAMTIQDYFSLSEGAHIDISVYQDWKKFKAILAATLTSKDWSATDDENVIFISKDAVARLKEPWELKTPVAELKELSDVQLEKILIAELTAKLEASRSLEDRDVKQQEEGEKYKRNQELRGSFALSNLRFSFIPRKVQEIESLNAKWEATHCKDKKGVRVSQSHGTHFACAQMSLRRLCAKLNEIHMFNREFVLLEEFSGKPKPHLRMTCKGIDDTEVEKFILLLQKYSVNAAKGQSRDGSRIVVIYGVQDKNIFLGCKKELIRFAKEYNLLAMTAIKPPAQ